METIVKIFAGIVAVIFSYYFIKKMISTIVKKWPVIIWILGVGIGSLIGSEFHWIAGIIGGLFTIGVLTQLQTSGTKKCPTCGSYDTEMKQTIFIGNQTAEVWECKKCGQQTGFV